MKLLDHSGYRPDPYQRPAKGEAATIPHALLPLDELADALRLKDQTRQIGVEVPNTANVAELARDFTQLSLIAIVFPAFSDGRGFSLARRLRRAGFTGTLRATGPLIADQFAYALACGFDEIELPDASAGRQPADQWQHAAGSITSGYQRGYVTPGSILDRRRAAASVASND